MTKKLNFEVKQQMTFVHHALWSLCHFPEEQLPVELIADVMEFRNKIEPYIKQSEDSYMHSVPRGGAKLLCKAII